MHACGHDGHTSTLLGVAEILKSIERDLPVCVKFIWQPAEEGGGGGNVLCKAGVLDGRIGPKVAAIFGLHGWPGMPVGIVSTSPANCWRRRINSSRRLSARGVTGAFPHLGRDPIIAAAEAVVNLQQFVSREMDPTDSAVVTVGHIQRGDRDEHHSRSRQIEGTARTLNEPARKRIREAIERRCRGIALASDCELEFELAGGLSADGERSGDGGLCRAQIAKKTLGAGPIHSRCPAGDGRRGFRVLPGEGAGVFFPGGRFAEMRSLSAIA